MADQRLCNACDKPNREQARFCGYCGQSFQDTTARGDAQFSDNATPEWVKEVHRSPAPLGKIVGGVVGVSLGLFTYLWASQHSPNLGFGEMLMKAAQDPNHYIIKEPVYSVILVVAAGLSLLGVCLIGFGLIAQAKK